MGKHLQSFNEHSKNEKLDLSDVSDSEKFVNRFIDYLFNNNDLFYNLGDGRYEYDKNKGTITFDLSSYGTQKNRFIEQINDIINDMYNTITIINKDNKLILYIN